MLIDWFTVIAQIVNFLILVALLKHFLYGRIIKAMDEREHKIASRLDAARQREEEATREAESYRKRDRELEAKWGEYLSQAREEAERQRGELMDKAREEIDQVQERWRKAVRQERDSFLRELKSGIKEQVCRIARRVVRDLADTDLEEQIVATFAGRLGSLPGEEKRKIASSAGKGEQTLTVVSGFELSPGARGKVGAALKGIAGDGVEVVYRTSPDMTLGVELRSPGRKLSWGLDEYLQSLEASIGRLLEEEGREPPEGEAASEGAQEGATEA